VLCKKLIPGQEELERSNLTYELVADGLPEAGDVVVHLKPRPELNDEKEIRIVVPSASAVVHMYECTIPDE
jgi:hypothetical protein